MPRRGNRKQHHRRAWLHWLGVYGGVMGYCFVYRCVALAAIMESFGAADEQKWTNRALGICVGLLEDWACATPLVLMLYGFDRCTRPSAWRESRVRHGAKRALRFCVFLVLYVLWILPSGADWLLVRIRHMRFTFEFIEAYFNAKGAASLLRVSEYEVRVARETVVVTVIAALAFAAACTIWIDLSLWSPSDALASLSKHGVDPKIKKQYERVSSDHDHDNDDHDSHDEENDLEDGGQAPKQSKSLAASVQKNAAYRSARHDTSQDKAKWIWRSLLVLTVPVVVVTVAHACSPIVASVALNTSLNEFFRILFDIELYPGLASAEIGSAAYYISPETENFTLFEDNVLYRRTLGFHGPLAFDVKVEPEDPPNVLVIAVESFRYHDSQYLVGNNTYLLKDANITVTPHFDKWAKRGIGFRNLWSSWTTSRSLESILFGQIPYDSIPDSGTSGGRTNVKLSGMPQFFKAKGYEPTFITGCPIKYDQWEYFLPTHGFDTVLAMDDVKKLAERDLGIRPEDWEISSRDGAARAMSDWGVHDDVSFQVLGNLIKNKTEEQKARTRAGKPKTPFFINHYTISTHTPYTDHPQWYAKYKKPDFSPLYKDYVTARNDGSAVKNYLEMRYFQDLALGEFLDRMQKEGILNDTIVVVVGDHGQGPENGLVAPESRQISATRVAAMILAEGRLRDGDAGTLVDDVAEHYDLLNTLADIVGVPETGFLQTSVGRSLKRQQIPTSERVVWSNNPARKMAAIKGHLRLQYDAMSTSIQLHDTEKDHELAHDLYPQLTKEEKREWDGLRDAGRHLNLYFKRRWKRACLTKVKC